MSDPVNLHGEPVPFDHKRAAFLRQMAENYDYVKANGDPPTAAIWIYLDDDGIGGAGWFTDFNTQPVRALIMASIGVLHLALSQVLGNRSKVTEYRFPPPPEDDPDNAA